MRRKYAQPALPTLYFKDGILSVPGYTFEKVRALQSPIESSQKSTRVVPRVLPLSLQAVPWEDTGSMTLLAEGTNLQDGTSVLAKIVPAHSNASMLLEREAHM